MEAELARLTKENDDLRTKLSSPGRLARRPAPGRRRPSPPAAERLPSRPPRPRPRAASPAETIRVETVPQASNAAARLLEIATRNADELVDEAKNDADRIVGEARTKAERLEAESKIEVRPARDRARTRAQMLDSETAERRQQMFGDLEKERDKLNIEVENLRSFEREYRSRLKSYFTQQLEALNGSAETAAPAGEDQPAPKRLRSILGEDDA